MLNMYQGHLQVRMQDLDVVYLSGKPNVAVVMEQMNWFEQDALVVYFKGIFVFHSSSLKFIYLFLFFYIGV